ncbi:cupin domain-containing protein [Enterococcus hulanensis]|uniref:cupin domain-containing protein n=1 Tax=Enterococcus hulanensis TaxID=2559929 RepID=UPI001A919E38|nr:cupin domain-containing protein [Enterococcus hulanensis]
MEVINLNEKFSQFSEFWSPKVIGSLEGYQIKIAKFKDEFIWHTHEKEDEFFLVISGRVDLHVKQNGKVEVFTLNDGEGLVVPQGIEHMPVSKGISNVLLFEPATTLNTGNVINEMTVEEIEKI